MIYFEKPGFSKIIPISCFLCATAVAWEPVWKPDTTSEFEVGTQVRAWTIHDEGMTTILDNMQSMAGINSLYMVVVMHQEHRPFQAPEFPHNPARDSWKAEDSRVTFFPDLKRYGEVKPLLSDVDWLKDTDWLQLMVDSARGRGLAVGAEVSHYPIPKSIVKQHGEWHQKKKDGKTWKDTRFCPNNPEVRQYVIALFGDLAANYDLDYIQTCQHLFNDQDMNKGGTCFCRHCIAAAEKTGFDLEKREDWLQFRRNSNTEFYRLIAEEIKKVKKNPKCHLRYNDFWAYNGRDPIDFSIHIDDMAKHLGSLVNADHQEQNGKKNETFSLRKKWLTKNRAFIGPDMPLICGTSARIKATPELVRAGIKVALEHPAKVNGLALKHYDGASFGLLRAYKQGMIEAGVKGLPPTIGKEVEEMKLDNYTPINDFKEDWGVETKGRGSASYTFDDSSGTYDIRITYFDDENGKGDVTLLVAGEEKISFTLDEDTDCWRWRLFENIRVNNGDEITLVGNADGAERARLDFIEFIPEKKEVSAIHPIPAHKNTQPQLVLIGAGSGFMEGQCAGENADCSKLFELNGKQFKSAPGRWKLVLKLDE